MVGNLCAMWGKELGEVDGVQYRDFPPPGKLSGDGVEQKLRELGFGYRAKYIAAAAKIVDERGEGWLEGLRKIEYRDAHEALLELPGVGPKVADCVCLMSLDKAEAVPVDTHGLSHPHQLLACSRANESNVQCSRSRRETTASEKPRISH